MLRAVGHPDLESLARAAVPATIAWGDGLDLPPALTESQATAALRRMADANTQAVSMIGLGYHDTITPAVIRRNVLESPGWYTAYTPYQPEISQGRLEALLNFQTMVADLTGLPLANASMLDEPTAAAEAMALLHRVDRTGAMTFVVDADTHPQTLAVLETRATPLGIVLDVRDMTAGLPSEGCFGVLVSVPTSTGLVRDPAALSALAEQVHALGAGLVVAADLLGLCLLTPPGECGADIVVGSAQRFGVPMGFGGPHAGVMAVRTGLERQLPGRLVGVSVDSSGKPAYRLALQTREQHIRRERATSNICTAQVLLAVIAGLYGAYHGPQGLRRIAERVHAHAAALAAGLRQDGVPLLHTDLLRHGRRGGARPCHAGRCGGRRPGDQPAAGRCRPRGDHHRRGDRRGARGGCPGGVQGGGSRGIGPGARRRTGAPGGVAPDLGLPRAPGVPRAPQRDRDAALPAPPGRLRRRAGPVDDPAGLVHDEAQRDDRDGADQLARLRRDPPLRPPGAVPGLRAS